MEIIRFVNGEKMPPERLKTLPGSHPQLVSAVQNVRRRLQAVQSGDKPVRKEVTR